MFAAETLAKAGFQVTVYERKTSLGRKFLMAGRGGLNITHSENIDIFKHRYGEAEKILAPMIDRFTPVNLRAWCEELGEKTFIGSSGRVFPESFKASPLLRSWIKRLEALGVSFKMQRDWIGWDTDNNLAFRLADQSIEISKPDFTLLALGGASWPNLGSDGSWVRTLEARDVSISPLRPSNCGFHVPWSDYFKNKFAGTPLKNISASFDNHTVQGEIMISDKGLEGGAIYALSATIRKSLEKNLKTILYLDLRPTAKLDELVRKLQQPQKRQTLSSYLQRTLNLSPVAINLMREVDRNIGDYPPERLATLIKNLPIEITSAFSIEKAISSAGGILFDELDENMMLKKIPGVFTAGEMINWEAPTGGYLLQASFATGHSAALGIINYASKS